MTSKKRISILGSTGSIGTQALEVIASHPDKLELIAISANGNDELLIEQAIRYKPKMVCIVNEKYFAGIAEALKPHPIEVVAGENGLREIAIHPEVDLVLTAVVGYAGLRPTIAAIKAKKNIALANKETLVVAGELIMKLAKENGVMIIPVDSEHSAIFQCLVGEQSPVEKIILTASGGPFRGKTKKDLASVTKVEALKHPNWNMGSKITIDSATLMNKGLETIEAKWLFNLNREKIEVVIHPQSIIHSIVQFTDGSMKAQMSLPDMRMPIQYAFSYPQRFESTFPRFDFTKINTLDFEQPDTKTFRNLALAFEAMDRGGNAPCVLNAANEIAVDAFLNDRIGFLEMSDLIENCLQKINFISEPSFEDYVLTDEQTRLKAKEFIN